MKRLLTIIIYTHHIYTLHCIAFIPKATTVARHSAINVQKVEARDALFVIKGIGLVLTTGTEGFGDTAGYGWIVGQVQVFCIVKKHNKVSDTSAHASSIFHGTDSPKFTKSFHSVGTAPVKALPFKDNSRRVVNNPS